MHCSIHYTRFDHRSMRYTSPLSPVSEWLVNEGMWMLVCNARLLCTRRLLFLLHIDAGDFIKQQSFSRGILSFQELSDQPIDPNYFECIPFHYHVNLRCGIMSPTGQTMDLVLHNKNWKSRKSTYFNPQCKYDFSVQYQCQIVIFQCRL